MSLLPQHERDAILSVKLVTGYCRKYEQILSILIPAEITQLSLIYYHSIRLQTYTIQPPLKYTSLLAVNGSLAILEHVKNVSYGTTVNISPDKLGEIIEIEEHKVIISLFQGPRDIDEHTQFQFANKEMRIGVSRCMLGRIFDGIGNPIDGIPNFIPETLLKIKNNSLINPLQRVGATQIIETGISVIDTMTPIALGSKVAFMSGAGLPHNEILAQIIKQSRILNKDNKYESSANFAIVLVSIGNNMETTRYFKQELKESCLMMDSVLFINNANDPSIERTIMPHIGMTVAEYLAFVHDKNVMVILHDMTAFAWAYRDKLWPPTAMGHGKKFPYSLQSELSSIFERAYVGKECKGSITVFSVVTMPNDDINHPVPQWIANNMDAIICVDRDLYKRDIYPPINVLRSISYSMKRLLTNGFQGDDHLQIVDEIIKYYMMAKNVEAQMAVIGITSLSSEDKLPLYFLCKFNNEFVKQKDNESRSMSNSVDLLRSLLSILS